MAAKPKKQKASPKARAPTRTPTLNRLLAFLGDGLLAFVVVLAVLRFMLPSFSGWFHEDDTHNLRWVLEYRSEPWRALTERHAVHDHIRPLTLLAFWLGTYLSNGAFWGPHLIEALLQLGGLAGLLMLGRELGQSWRAGILAALFGVGVWGFERIMDWTAWMCSAGEVCFGFWALVVAKRAIERWVWLPLAMLFVVAAGLFKEPGSVVYPIGALAIGIVAWREGAPLRRAARVLVLLPVGLATFAYTWNAANITRLSRSSASLLDRALVFVNAQADQMINGWPGWSVTNTRFGAGIPLLVFFAVIVEDLIGREEVRRPLGKLIWLYGALATALLGYLWGDFVQAILVPAVLLALVRNYRRPPVGLVIYLAAVAVMMPFSLPNEVQLLAAGYGLALYVGVAATQMLQRWPQGERVVPAVAAVSIAAQLVLIGGRVLLPINLNVYDRQEIEEHRVMGIGALARTLGLSKASVAGMSTYDQEILPLVGVLAETGSTDSSNPPTVGLGEELLFAPQRGVVERVLLAPDRIQGLRLPVYPATGNDVPKPGGTTGIGNTGVGASGGGQDGQKPATLEVEPGYYALGVGATVGSQMNLTLNANDLCGHSWSVEPQTVWPVPFLVEPIYVEKGCEMLKLSWSGTEAKPTGIAFLSPLQEPIVSLWFPMVIPRVLEVRADQSKMAKGGMPKTAPPGDMR